MLIEGQLDKSSLMTFGETQTENGMLQHENCYPSIAIDMIDTKL